MFGERLVRAVGRLPLRSSLLTAWSERHFQRSAHAFRGVYSTYDEAMAAAPKDRQLGYDNAEAAAYYRERLHQVYPADYPVLFWLREIFESGARTVFDLGGHVGIGFFAYQKFLQYPEGLQWRVCDVPAVCEAGRGLAAESNAEALSFTTDRSEATDFDVLFTSGALQYLEEGFIDVLAALSRPPRHLLLNLVPLGPNPPFYTLQTIGVAYCPYRIESSDTLTRGLADLGYEAVDLWENPEKSCFIPFHPENSLDAYQGGYFRQQQIDGHV